MVFSLIGTSVILREATPGFIVLGNPGVIGWDYLVNGARRFVRWRSGDSLFPKRVRVSSKRCYACCSVRQRRAASQQISRHSIHPYRFVTPKLKRGLPRA